MFRLRRFFTGIMFIAVLLLPNFSNASFSFVDERFTGDFSTENIDAILEEYELFDSWYWSTEGDVIQSYHGQKECKAWTESTVVRNKKKDYTKGWFGCRWFTDKVMASSPNHGGYGECFGFAQFIGYLLSGETNPQKNWNKYYSIEAAGGLRVGDIIRVEYTKNKKPVHHSAVVYKIDGDNYLFIQISGSNYNQISIGKGFTDGNMIDERRIENLVLLPGIKICRSPLNTDSVETENTRQ